MSSRGRRNVLFYVNSWFGFGHYQRVATIVKALSRHHDAIEATVLIGGVPTTLFDKADRCRVIRLAGLICDGVLPGEILRPLDADLNLAEVYDMRKELIRSAVGDTRFDAVVTEYFPFARHAVKEEVMLMLGEVKKRNADCRIVASVRDAVHDLSPGARHWIENTINTWFDYVLVHSDPSLLSFDVSYGRVEPFADKLKYTGFVVREYIPRMSPAVDRSVVIVSTGGGRDGAGAIDAALDAIGNLAQIGYSPEVIIYPGPFFPQAKAQLIRGRLKHLPTHVAVAIGEAVGYRETLHRARVSVSMAGYNTCYELLAMGVPMVLWPRRRREQLLRADVLSSIGAARVAATVGSLENHLVGILNGLTSVPLNQTRYRFDGAVRTADFIAGLCGLSGAGETCL